jgi:hypothetical protein
MADWFNELVEKVCAEVLAREDVRHNLALADPARVTAKSITQQIVGIGETGRLRDLLAEPIGAVEQLDRQRDGMVRELLPGEWRTVAEAEARQRRARRQLRNASSARRSAGGSVSFPSEATRDSLSAWTRISSGSARRWLRLGRSVPVRDLRAEAQSANTTLEQARQAFSTAAADESIRQHPMFGEIDAERAEAVSVLPGQLHEVLAGRINLIIDGAIAASYEPEFSFSGSAWLVDQPGEDAEVFGAEINGEAISAIKNMIDSDLTGAVGVAGPRGIGKTTLLTRFARCTPDLWPSPPWKDGKAVQQWGVSVAAPAQYDARDFLLHLFGQLCASVLGEERIRTLEDEMTGTDGGLGRPRLPVVLFTSYLAVTSLMCGAVVVGLETSRPVESTRSMADLLIAGCCVVVAVVTAMVPSRSLGSWAWRMAQNDRRRLELAQQSSYEKADPLYQVRLRKIYNRTQLARAAIVATSGISAGALFPLVAVGRPPNPGYLAVIALAVPVAPLYVVLRSRVWYAETVTRVRNDYTAQASAAESWYQKVKFQQTYTTGWSGTVTLSPSALPVQAQAGWSGSKAMTSVSMSVPEIVAALRSFSEVLRRGPRTAKGSSPVPVVVGIDEVDKIEDPRTAQAFFNQIKGLFGDTPCLFLISISDDAMAAYERRGLALRDAFDSSLSTVITLSYLSRREARRLIGSRLVRITQPSADLLYVLSGGLPRELVRLIRHAVGLQRAYTAGDLQMDEAQAASQPRADLADAVPGGWPVARGQGPWSGDTNSWDTRPKLAPVPLDLLTVALTAEQVAAQRRAVLIRGRMLEPCKARNTLLAWAGDPAVDAWPAGRGGAKATAAAEYFASLLGKGAELMDACDGAVNVAETRSGTAHADGCAAQETGAFLFWLATVGQVFGSCKTRADFEDAERQESARSFERLARARQNFSLGPGYVQAAVTSVRTAWDLAQGHGKVLN